MPNIRRPAKKTCYIRACKNVAAVWILRSEGMGGEYETVEAKVCNSCARGHQRAADQSG